MIDIDDFEVPSFNGNSKGREVLLPSGTKRSVEKAISHAIMNGAKVDIHKSTDTQVFPKAGVQFSKDGISIGIGLAIHHSSSKTYKMKD